MQAHIYYSGMVQGVGFRYTVHSIATRLQATGWVRNLNDGRVEALIEGEQATIDQVCHQIEDHFQTNITDKEITLEDKNVEFSDFQITF